jgi:tetratricopeptide (TPR) repeat protein
MKASLYVHVVAFHFFCIAAFVGTPHQIAVDLYREHKYPEAAEAFRKALETEKPGDADFDESNLLLGQSLFLTGKSTEAIPYLRKAKQTNEVLYMLGTAAIKIRELPQAEAAFATMYGVDAASAAAHLITAQMMIRADLEDEAEKEAQQALEVDPRLPQARYVLAEIRTFHGASDDAIALLKQEIAINPDFAMAYYKLGDAYTRKSDWRTAIVYLQKSIWLNPDFSGPYILLGKCYLNLDQLPDAEGVLRHAIAVDPKNYSAHYLLGTVLTRQGKTEEGRAILEQSQKLKR